MKEVKKSWSFRQSPQEVWEYLTNPELLEQWLMKSDIKPVVGHKFQFVHVPKNDGNYEGLVRCEVLEVNPYTRLAYSWSGRTKDESRTFNSNVVWTLVPKDNGTELQLHHHGFELAEDMETHSKGWETCIKRLEGRLNPVAA